MAFLLCSISMVSVARAFFCSVKSDARALLEQVKKSIELDFQWMRSHWSRALLCVWCGQSCHIGLLTRWP